MYHQSYYKRIGTDLARQTNTTITQQINFTEKLEKDDDATRSFIVKEQKSYYKLFFRFNRRNRIIQKMEHQKY